MDENEKKYHFSSGPFEFEVPEYMRDGLEYYIQLGLNPGDFLTAVIINDLKGAVQAADEINIGNIPAYVNYLYNHAPVGCWGSVQHYEAWVEDGGLIGLQRQLAYEKCRESLDLQEAGNE